MLIWPIDPVLEADQQASALWLENRGTETANLQIRVFAWSQSGFDEQYQNQRDVIGSPPVAKIEPGQKQLVRLTRTKQVPPGQELAYRIIIDEIPSATPPPAPADGKTAAAIRFQMRYSVPLFSYGPGLWSKVDGTRDRDPKSAGKPDLSWKKSHRGRAQLRRNAQPGCRARALDRCHIQAGRPTSSAGGRLDGVCTAGCDHALASTGWTAGRSAAAGTRQWCNAIGEPCAGAIKHCLSGKDQPVVLTDGDVH